MTLTRRHFLKTCAAAGLGFAGFHSLFDGPLEAFADATRVWDGYGPLVRDPAGVLDLPAGFSYRVISRVGDEMSDGLLVPGLPDAMATFPGPDGLTLIVRNHELHPMHTEGPWGPGNERLARVPTSRIYDIGAGVTPCNGGTTTIVFDTKTQQIRRQYLSLVGTLRNCAGGPTPWNSWISCEENSRRAGHYEEEGLWTSRDHGYNFEVPASAEIALVEPLPLKSMGRFVHEAVGVDPRTGFVYQTEDRSDGLVYRFIPAQRGKLAAGGRLQAMGLADGRITDTRNWPNQPATIEKGVRYPVRWIDLDDVESPEDDLRLRGAKAGACIFARGEGMWAGHDEVYFACTNGGREQLGQIWRYRPSSVEGTPAEVKSPGTLELFIEPNDSNLVMNADNLTISPWSDLIVCEDSGADVMRLIGVTPRGMCYPFAANRLRSEFAGAVFSPDGTTLFVNIQYEGKTFAIVGPWKKG